MINSQVAEIISLIVKPLIGEICSQTSFSYGDELILHFGELSNHTHPKLTHLKKGKWQLCTRASTWLLTKENVGITSSEKINTVGDYGIWLEKEMVKSLENKKLIDFIINKDTLFLKLNFEDGYSFGLLCDIENETELAHFEVFMPEHKVLIFGPKLDWEYKSILSKV